MNEILPTHSCFDDALEMLSDRILACRDDRRAAEQLADRLLVVHAECLGDDGTRYAHAWLEDGDLVWDAGIYDGVKIKFSCRREEFYDARRVQHMTKYTPYQAMRANKETFSYGPWLPRYRLLCSASRRIVGRVDAEPPRL